MNSRVRRDYAEDHIEGIETVEGVQTATLVSPSDDWLVVTVEFTMEPTTDASAEGVYERIVQWFVNMARPGSFTSLNRLSEATDESGRFAVNYPR